MNRNNLSLREGIGWGTCERLPGPTCMALTLDRDLGLILATLVHIYLHNLCIDVLKFCSYVYSFYFVQPLADSILPVNMHRTPVCIFPVYQYYHYYKCVIYIFL